MGSNLNISGSPENNREPPPSRIGKIVITISSIRSSFKNVELLYPVEPSFLVLQTNIRILNNTTWDIFNTEFHQLCRTNRGTQLLS